MEKEMIIESLDKFISNIDVIQAESGPKSNDFVKWVRDVKQFIEKAFGAEHPQLRALRKIDYYPKQFDILSSESAFKKAWIEGLMQAKAILEGLRTDVAGVLPKEEKQEEVKEKVKTVVEEPQSVDIKTETVINKPAPQEPPDAAPDMDIEIVKPVEIVEEIIAKNVEETPVKNKVKAEEKKESVMKKGKKVLLVNIQDAKLNENIFMFIKNMGYEPVVVDHSTEGDSFITDVMSSSIDEEAAYAIIHWNGDVECGGKKLPKPCAIFSTGYYVAKLTNKKVLIITYDDIYSNDENYKGLNFLVIDDIYELMELKLAKEMDAAGLNIDFNFLKKK
ncbi:MAG: hypothetical protein FWG57_05870 [Endomicrobia bacterium]|nr:hypothetical protein [Endomicrobiia bacterium]